MTFNVLTLFPGIFDGFLSETILKKALEKKLLEVNLVNIRDFATDKHKTTDDTPYGGGPGMVMKIEPIFRALEALKMEASSQPAAGEARSWRQPVASGQKHASRRPTGYARLATGSRTILLSPRGTPFTQKKAEQYAKLQSLTLICGRYEGVDQRVADHLADEELSIGPYVLSGGEVPAMVVIEAVSRLLPGVLGNPESLKEESFSAQKNRKQKTENSRPRSPVYSFPFTDFPSVEYPHYTKPETFNEWSVPDVLVSGNHAKIAEWRKKQTRRTSSH
jgi:tRNA (guanine37-N1)-methyltransferase